MVQPTGPQGPHEAAFRPMFDASGDAMVLADPETHTICDANAAASAVFGYTRDELLTLRTIDLIHSNSIAFRMLAGQPYGRMMLDGRRKDGSAVPLEISASTFFEGQRSIRCVVAREVSKEVRDFDIMQARVAERTRQLTALLHVSGALGRTLELQNLLDVVLDELSGVVEYTQAMIAYQEGDELCLKSYRGPLPREQALSLRVQVEQAPVYRAVRERRGQVIIADIEHDTQLALPDMAGDARRVAPNPLSVGSILGVPLVRQDQIVGVLRLDHVERGFYTYAHADVAVAIANQASIAIENARLFESVERRQHELQVLYDAEARLSRTLEPQDVLEALAHTATELLNADKTSVLTWDGERRRLTVRATRGFDPQALALMPDPVGEGLSTLAATTREIVDTQDAQNDRRICDTLRAVNVAEKIRAIISVPITSDDEVFGVFNLQYQHARTFAADDRRILQSFAHLAAIALQNARLFEAERITRERLDVALDAGQMGAWDWDIDTDVVTWSRQLELIHGLPPGGFPGTFEGYLADVHPDDVERVRQTIEASLETGEHHLEYRIVWPDSSVHWVEAHGRTIRDHAGNVVGMRGVCQDITRRKNQESEQIQLQARERAASRARAGLEERQRLARDLHDSVSQALYGITLGAQTALAAVRDDGDSADAERAIGYVHRLAEAAITEMRALIFELRPETLEQEGLVAALERHVAVLRSRHGLEVRAKLCVEPDIEIEKKDALYRIARESLHNATKHARARMIEVCLQEVDERVVLELADDGVGFDPSRTYPGHLGVVSMRERAAAAGATLSITSAPGRGTRIRVELPR
ncbi:MAG: GAF domain-containing protein [Chloroflexi bacterium]|nr:GAF domain-containing protein [Chloroflexota bacterium]